MGWLKDTVAPPAHPGHAKTNTQVRRLQRKHTQHSYRQMKVKLLSLINPSPALAIKAADLEAFRESIYIWLQSQSLFCLYTQTACALGAAFGSLCPAFLQVAQGSWVTSQQ